MDPARDPKTFAARFEFDYFRRARPLRRWKWWLSAAALVVSTVVVATLMAAPRLHTAFQAAPVSHSHAFFGEHCAMCHDQPFGVAARLIPGSRAGTVSDGKCLACHDAGLHSPHQLQHVGADGKAAGCIECHKEHRGEALSKLPDLACVNCHGDLKTSSGTKNIAGHIHHFADDHPSFAAWRGADLIDPAGGKFRFNHKRHLELSNELKDIDPATRPGLAAEFAKLWQLDCAYCHQQDADMKRMLPISYDDHCSKCHPLSIQAMPANHWPADAAASFAKQPVPHPKPGTGPESVRAEIIRRYLALGERAKPSSASVAPSPSVLSSVEDSRTILEQERLAQVRTQQTESQLFNGSTGCGLCHVELSRQSDGLPMYALSHQQHGRWDHVKSSWPIERLRTATYANDANRWHPLATFNHGVHRTYACTTCHSATHSTTTEQVLIPTIDTCRTCHNRSAASARSDCLTCHHYHDRSRERAALIDTPEILKPLLQRKQP